MAGMEQDFVVVTTDKRGVFAGYYVEGADRVVELRDGQNCLYWSAETRGVLGLAANGPAAGSRIGPPVSRLMLTGVTSISIATAEATVKWQAQPWS